MFSTQSRLIRNVKDQNIVCINIYLNIDADARCDQNLALFLVQTPYTDSHTILILPTINPKTIKTYPGEASY